MYLRPWADTTTSVNPTLIRSTTAGVSTTQHTQASVLARWRLSTVARKLFGSLEDLQLDNRASTGGLF